MTEKYVLYTDILRERNEHEVSKEERVTAERGLGSTAGGPVNRLRPDGRFPFRWATWVVTSST